MKISKVILDPFEVFSLKKLFVRVESIFLFFGIIIFRALSDLSYPIIWKVFSYENPFIYNPSFFSSILSWIFLLSYYPFILKIYYQRNLSSYVAFFLILVSLIPISTMIMANQDYELLYLVLVYLYWFILLYLICYFPSINLDVLIRTRSEIIYILTAIILSISVIYLSWTNTGFRFLFNILDSSLIYDLRVEAREYSSIPFLGYLIHAGDNILPLLMVYLLCRGKYVFGSIIAFVVLLNFGITASKQIIFLLIIGLFAYFFIRKYAIQRIFLLGIILITSISILEFYVFDSAISSMFSTYRIFFIPAKYQYIYYDFFTLYEPDFFRQSILGLFFDSPYERSLHMILADFHNNDYYARANTGLFADAFMNLGYLGVFVFPFLIAIVLKILDGASQNLYPSVLFFLAICFGFLLLNLNLSIALMTGGIILMTPIIYSLPRS